MPKMHIPGGEEKAKPLPAASLTTTGESVATLNRTAPALKPSVAKIEPEKKMRAEVVLFAKHIDYLSAEATRRMMRGTKRQPDSSAVLRELIDEAIRARRYG